MDVADLPDRGTIVKAPVATTDAYNNPVRDWTSALRIENVPGSLQPRTVSEQASDRQATLSSFVLFLMPDASITADDRWELDGDSYEVAGEPQLWRSDGQAHHLEVPLERIVVA